MTTGATTFRQLLKERRERKALYHAPAYWDARVAAREGMARTMWPSNRYNELWDARQRELLARHLGDLAGRRVLDVGCGTGRMTRWLASQGARACVGVDYSGASVEAARRESAGEPRVRFVAADVIEGIDAGPEPFDDAVVIGCLALGCKHEDDLSRALANIARVVRPGGRVALLEPVHTSRLLRRVLSLSARAWIAVAARAGLRLVARDRMGFVPARLVLSVRDLPRALVAPAFAAGERLLDRAPAIEALSDYKLLVFENDGSRGDGTS